MVHLSYNETVHKHSHNYTHYNQSNEPKNHYAQWPQDTNSLYWTVRVRGHPADLGAQRRCEAVRVPGHPADLRQTCQQCRGYTRRDPCDSRCLWSLRYPQRYSKNLHGRLRRAWTLLPALLSGRTQLAGDIEPSASAFCFLILFVQLFEACRRLGRVVC